MENDVFAFESGIERNIIKIVRKKIL